MDAVLADRLCSAVAANTTVPALPTSALRLLASGTCRRWPGTISVATRTLSDLVQAIETGPIIHGLRRLFSSYPCDQGGALRARSKCSPRAYDMMVALFNSAT